MRAGTRQEYVILSTCHSPVAEQFTNQSTNQKQSAPDIISIICMHASLTRVRMQKSM
jgi:hypothetical protein